MDKVVHFEIPADDIERAKEFYKTCFGWKMQTDPKMGYTMVSTIEVDEKMRMPKEPGAINGGMFMPQADMPHPQIFINVKDIEKALKKVSAEGGQILRNKMPVGTMGFVANFKDTEGNVVGLWRTTGKGQLASSNPLPGSGFSAIKDHLSSDDESCSMVYDRRNNEH